MWLFETRHYLESQKEKNYLKGRVGLTPAYDNYSRPENIRVFNSSNVYEIAIVFLIFIQR